MTTHQPYPNDVSDAEWQFVAPYLCLLPQDAGQRVQDLRDIFDAPRWIARSGSPWRYVAFSMLMLHKAVPHIVYSP